MIDEASEENQSKMTTFLDEDGNPGGIIYPSLDPMIFELKNPNKDIKGRAR